LSRIITEQWGLNWGKQGNKLNTRGADLSYWQPPCFIIYTTTAIMIA
jgi:hypothetical protein